MKNRKNFLSASVALAALLFVSINVSAAQPTTTKDVDTLDAKINRLDRDIKRMSQNAHTEHSKVKALERILLLKKFCTEDELREVYKFAGVY